MNHLLKAVEILKRRYAGEIYDSGDWSHNLWGWTVTICINEDDETSYDVVAYRAKDNVTDWSDYVKLDSYNVQFELV
jgi:arginine decarboxylase-like protein